MKRILLLGLSFWILANDWNHAAVGSNSATVIERPLLAYWTFDEEGPLTVLHDVSRTNGCDAEVKGVITAIPGIYGKGISLHEPHALKVNGKMLPKDLAKITISAWVRPLDLGNYKEIMRQECESRVLFSFQNHGSILSLGLNIDGYAECDASISADKILAGLWHHCAGTFDGETMRVYLDGVEVGALRRPGRPSIRNDVPLFIGSSSGHNEFFEGEMDDLRVYADALTPEDISRLYKGGIEQAALLEKQARSTGSLKGKSFAEALVGVRQKVMENGGKIDSAAVFEFQLAFPRECSFFREWANMDVAAYVKAGDRDLNQKIAERLVDLLVEYMPLTDWQWKKQSPADQKKWAEIKNIRAKYQKLTDGGDSARFSPEWIDVIMEAGGRIQFRPSKREAVAPYAKAVTPETKSLSPEESREALEKDWLHQANGKTDKDRIVKEIGWIRELGKRISGDSGGKADFASELAELSKLDVQVQKLTGQDNDLYFKVREIKRRIMFKNPAVDFNKVVFVDMPFPRGSEWPHETRHRLGYMAVPGARLLVLEGLGPDGKLRQLMPQAPLHGSFWRPDVSWDGKKVLFCYKPHNEKSFHLYDINADGSGLVQLTDGIFDDMDPVYLPDERHIIFSTSRSHTYVRCMPPTSAYVLARCDRDGKNIYLISANNEPDYLPSVMNDGRVIYTRWEYTDKPLWRAQKLWTINPDGTQVSTYWGNQSVWPDVMKDVRSIPGTRRVMFTGCGHHNWFAGCVGIIDPDKGFNFPKGLTKVTADVTWPEVGNGPTDPVESERYHASGIYPAYYSPYPLSEHDFLVSARRAGNVGDRFSLFLMDVDGNRELIYEGVHNILHAMPLKARTRPPVIHDRVIWPKKEEHLKPKDGVIFSGNVYQGTSGEMNGKAKYLRVLHIDPKTYTYWYKRPYLSTGPVVSAVQSEGVKRVLGTVPIEKDGSVSFSAPPGKALHFQLLDEKQRAMQTMRSFVGVMPGESRGCIGCHESHSRAPANPETVIALRNPPKKITPLPWGDDTVSYPRYVRPVLDKYCVKCHEGNGEGKKVFDMTERPSQPVFPEPYHTIIGRPTWGKPYKKPDNAPGGWGIAGMILVEGFSTTDPQAYVTPKPMTALSYTSPLIERVSNGKHHKVKVDDISRLKLILWVDAMCPYLGDEELRQESDPVFPGVDWLSIRPRIKTAPVIVRPGPIDDWKIEE
ncbi:MAG: hypothetical protein PHR77_11655 [Kiritimatiellae bacterium]|nr:hypothetical protein [Kiritimatiellia bacterium]MDD5521168.1 hypothetical protein [Kiritimatiellia bacterium]